MEDESVDRLRAENVGYKMAFQVSLLVLRDVMPSVAENRVSQAAVARSKDVLSLARGELLCLPPEHRDDLADDSDQHMRAKLVELLDELEEVLASA